MARQPPGVRDLWAVAAMLIGAGACVVLASAPEDRSDRSPAASNAEDAPTPPSTEPEAPGAEDMPAPAIGEETLVVTRAGRRLTGRLIRFDDASITLEVAGVALSIPRPDVERVLAQRPLVARYHEMRSLIDDGDSTRLLVLARWLMSNGLVAEAITETDHVLRVDPTNADAVQLRTLLGRQATLLEQDGAGLAGRGGPHDAGEGPDDDAPARHADPSPFPLLTPQQINLMKVYEIDLERPPRMLISRETIERLMQAYAGNALIPATREGRERFLSLPAPEILNVMFRLQAREFYGEVRVMESPSSMTRFRDAVNRGWLATSCASSQCHGGDGAGRLRLYNRRASSEAAYFTNFLLLERFRLSDGTPIINYKQPERSPLIQLGLPRQDSLKPHPEARGWAPTFKSMNDKRIGQTLDWIRSMYMPRPEHPVEYTPPVADLPPRREPGVER